MSFVSANDHPSPVSPQDPLYYAPRSVRSMADPRSNSMQQTRPDSLPPASSLSRIEEMREEAFAKYTRPLDSRTRSRTPSITRTARHCWRNYRSDWCHCCCGASFSKRISEAKK